ncbi:MAG: hypothetical protein GY854_31735 [Deltaproteobacteria bacterium]|nr:hypothetical protein [Deltaproteobacteria bacterium]
MKKKTSSFSFFTTALILWSCHNQTVVEEERRDAGDEYRDSATGSDTTSNPKCEECDCGLFCSAAGQCIPMGTCMMDADCPCDNTKCDKELRVCVSSHGGDLCGECEYGTFCSTLGDCLRVGKCASDSDCPCRSDGITCDEVRQRCVDWSIVCQNIVITDTPNGQLDAGPPRLCTFPINLRACSIKENLFDVFLDAVSVPRNENSGWTLVSEENEVLFSLNGSFCELWQGDSVTELHIELRYEIDPLC